MTVIPLTQCSFHLTMISLVSLDAADARFRVLNDLLNTGNTVCGPGQVKKTESIKVINTYVRMYTGRDDTTKSLKELKKLQDELSYKNRDLT